MTRSRPLLTGLLLAAAAVMFFWQLGAVPLFEPDEGRYSDMPQTMIMSGDYMTPRMNWVSHYHKPPLSNWFVAASFKIFGFNEFAARFPSVALSLLLLFLLVKLGKFLFDFETGHLAGWILLTSVLYFAVSRLVTTDMALVFFTFTAMGSIAHLFFSEKHKIFFFYTAILALALGMLTKGPVCWMITLVPTVIFAIWKKRGFSIPWYHWIIGFILFWAVSLSWFLIVILQNDGAFDYFINHQLKGRILKGNMGRPKPFFFFLLVLPLGFLPWAAFLPAMLKWNLKNKSPYKEVRDRVHFVLVWFLVPFILFSLFRTKLATYVAPLFPPLALFAACFWRDWNAGKVPADRTVTVSGWVLSVAYMLMAAGGLIFIFFRPEFVKGIPPAAVMIAAAVLFSASAISISVLRAGRRDLIFKSQAAIMALVILIATTALPSIRYENTKDFAMKIMELKKPGDKVVMWRNYYSSLPFYLKERIITMATYMEPEFDNPESYKDWVFDDPAAINPVFEGPSRVFVLTNEKMFQHIPEFTKAPVYILMRQRKLVLFSNRPD